MRYSAESDANSSLAVLLASAQEEPVFIEQDRREIAVLLSAAEYDRLRCSANKDFQTFCDSVSEKASARGLTEAKLNELLSNA